MRYLTYPAPGPDGRNEMLSVQSIEVFGDGRVRVGFAAATDEQHEEARMWALIDRATTSVAAAIHPALFW